ncbi:FAD-dependent oxidoreductase, partial [Candidatus Saccharibacteria bacterium]|nr:FAD-dependent oxidoreductase [Candidatus Saccharibacteria bacterium]
TCDGNFYKGKTVAVVGGGNTALEDVIYLAELCEKVYLIHRREEFRGDEVSVAKVKGLKNVELVLSANVREILGEEKVEGLEVELKDGERKEIKVDGVFFAIGYEPQAGIFADSVELDEKGYIKTKDGVHTSAEGIYVAGDVRKKDLKQLVTAASDGAIAANVAIKEME